MSLKLNKYKNQMKSSHQIIFNSNMEFQSLFYWLLLPNVCAEALDKKLTEEG